MGCCYKCTSRVLNCHSACNRHKQEQEFKKKEKAWLQKKEGDIFTIEAIKNIKNRQAKSTYRVRGF